MSKAFRARFDSECVECFGMIWEGDLIVMTDDGAVHEECAELPPEPVTFPL